MDHQGDSGFVPIGNYALLSDCENTCLVAPTGAIEWMCLPLPHDSSVFSALLDRTTGSFRIAPSGVTAPVHRRYVPGTMMLETVWQTSSGWLSVTDFLAVVLRHPEARRSSHRTRPPGDYRARHVLIRTARCLHGNIDVDVSVEPVLNYGATPATWAYTTDGYEQLSTINDATTPLHVASNVGFGIEGAAIRARHRLGAGESLFVTMSWGEHTTLTNPDEIDQALTHTGYFWRNWLDGGQFPDHPWKETLQRSALTLKALTYSPTGALLAAPTTSLPELLGGSRNWDYRYTWIRDSTFALQALNALGFYHDADDYLAFLSEVLESSLAEPGEVDAASFKVLYPVDGSEIVPEAQLSYLSGYENSQPVRIGNAAVGQVQLDVLGAVVDCIHEHARSRDTLSERSWRLVRAAAEAAEKGWRTPDHGIWEMRAEPRHFTFSKIMCWVALDRGSKLARLHGDRDLSTRFAAEAELVREDVLANAVGPEGYFVQSYGSQDLDASLLAISLVGFLPGTDERVRATVLAIADKLASGPYIYRYASQTDDGLEGQLEASFTMCSFWLVEAFATIGEFERARIHVEHLLSAAGPLGLYAEQFDPLTATHLGNFPQAFSHLALINAVTALLQVS
jgi:GH15 family glucan-1,4-alpha-glucosidase